MISISWTNSVNILYFSQYAVLTKPSLKLKRTFQEKVKTEYFCSKNDANKIKICLNVVINTRTLDGKEHIEKRHIAKLTIFSKFE